MRITFKNGSVIENVSFISQDTENLVYIDGKTRFLMIDVYTIEEEEISSEIESEENNVNLRSELP